MSKQTFHNKTINKTELKAIIQATFESYSLIKATKLVEDFKKSGFYFATKAGISISIEDLKVPPTKNSLVLEKNEEIKLAYFHEKRGNINEVERFQKVIDTWYSTSDLLKNQLVEFFKSTDPLNPVYMMAFSGARGNLSQVRQLIGMRGLMSDPNGEIIDLPIKANFREGLTITDYLISAYGARKGIVDTALKTADSGYLTRRLVDVTQHVIIRERDCKTRNGIRLIYNPKRTKIENFVGRTLAKPIFQKEESRILVEADVILTSKHFNKIDFPTDLILRSPLICESSRSICQKCYGWNLAQGTLVELADAIGIIAAQSIGEPGTQLTMRTFHTGGVFTGESTNRLLSEFNGKVLFAEKLKTEIARTIYGEIVLKAINESHLFILTSQSQLIKITIKEDMLIYAQNNSYIKKGSLIAEIPNVNKHSNIYTKNVTSHVSGEVQFQNLKNSKIKTLVNSGLIWIATGQVYDLRPNMLIKTFDSTIIKNNTFAQTKLITPTNGLIKISDQNSILELSLINRFTLFPSHSLYQHNQEIIFYRNKKSTFHIDSKSNNSNLGIQKTKKYALPLPYQFFCVESSRISNKLNFKTYLINPKYPDHFILEHSLLFKLQKGKVIVPYLHETLVFPGELVNSSFRILKLSYCECIDFCDSVLTFQINPLSQWGVATSLYWTKGKTEFNLSVFDSEIISYTQLNNDNGTWIAKNRSFLQTSLTFLNHCTSVNFQLIRKEMLGTRTQKRLFSYFLIHKIVTNLPASVTKTSYAPSSFTYHVVKNQYMDSYSTIATINCIVKKKTRIKAIKTLRHQPTRLLFTTTANYKNYFRLNKSIIHNSKFIVIGDEIRSDKFAAYSGYNTSFQKQATKNDIKLRLSLPFFISIGTQISVQHGSLINEGESLCQLLYSRIISNDIVAGLPRIENLFEARMQKMPEPIIENPGIVKYKRDGVGIVVLEKQKSKGYEYDFSLKLKKGEIVFVGQPMTNNPRCPHTVLNAYFKYYCSFYTAKQAASLSITNIQTLLLSLVQEVYKSQGIGIADKHIEIIIRQITSKVKILRFNMGTFFIPTEFMELDQINYINTALKGVQKPLIEYRPTLLGITKVSLMTESFISAASFQETTRILAQAAVEGRVEWLRGLKENVILGRLIPAGTGFNSFNGTSLLNIRLKD
jgi:ribosomal protein S15P/S13E